MKKLQKGFTLIELMIVVAIIAILAAVAAPKFGQQIKKSRDAKGLAIISNWKTANQLYYSEYEDYYTGTTPFVTVASIGEFVDTTTVGQTTDINNRTANVAVGTNTNGADAAAKKKLGFTYSLETRTVNGKTTTEGVFAIAAAAGNDTMGEKWSEK